MKRRNYLANRSYSVPRHPGAITSRPPKDFKQGLAEPSPEILRIGAAAREPKDDEALGWLSLPVSHVASRPSVSHFAFSHLASRVLPLALSGAGSGEQGAECRGVTCQRRASGPVAI